MKNVFSDSIEFGFRVFVRSVDNLDYEKFSYLHIPKKKKKYLHVFGF